MKNPNHIPVWIISGLLNSGKTTLLERWAAEVAGRRFIFIVNEFAAVDVDTSTLAKHGLEIFAMPGSDIFGGWPAEIEDILRQIVTYEELPEFAEAPPVEGIVIEAGGMANPRGLQKLLTTTHLAAWFNVAGILTLVNPSRLFLALSYLPTIRAQIESANWLLLNKTDLYDELQLLKAEARLRKLRPDLSPLRCTHADAPVAWLENKSPQRSTGF